jgi:hypothetical protein
MRFTVRRALFAAMVFGLTLPHVGCGGGESLKSGPEGAAAGPPPTSEADYHKRDLEAHAAKTKPKAGGTQPRK